MPLGGGLFGVLKKKSVLQNILEVFLPHVPSPYIFTTHLQTVVLSVHHRGNMLSIVLFHMFVHPILVLFCYANVLLPPSGDSSFDFCPPFPFHCLIPLLRSKTGCSLH